MSGSLRLGRIAGIAIEVHYSWLIVFFLVTSSLLDALGRTTGVAALAWGAAIGGSLLFFGSVLAHELAHSLVANSYGRMIDRITLFVFGGLAHLRQEPPSPKVELLIALAGPGMSVVLAVVFGAASVLCRLAPVEIAPLRGALDWLAIVNGILAVFNLIPAFPLDGGRVLRAILWMTTRSFERATRIAASLGQGVGYLFIAIGVSRALLQGGNWIDSLWLAAIGWMLAQAAGQSLRRAVIDGALEGVTVGEVMTTPCPSVTRDEALHEVVYNTLVRRRLSEVPVVDHGIPLGLLDTAHVQSIAQEYWSTTTVEHVMQPFPKELTVEPGDLATKALFRMMSEGASVLYVLDQTGMLAGSLSQHDLSQAVSIGMALGRGTGRGGGYRYPVAAPPAAPVSVAVDQTPELNPGPEAGTPGPRA